jgi:hypothetical protein
MLRSSSLTMNVIHIHIPLAAVVVFTALQEERRAAFAYLDQEERRNSTNKYSIKIKMSQYVDATAGAVEHCESMAKEFPDLAEPFYTPMADACRQKLWHQLTLLVLEFVARNASKTARTLPESGTHNFLALYDKVITRVDSKLHPLLLCKIAVHVSNALVATDVTAAKAVLENLVANKKDNIGMPATIFVESKLALLVLNTTTTEGGAGDASMVGDDNAAGSAASDEKTTLASVLKVLKANTAKLEDLRMLATAATRPVERDHDRGRAGGAAAAAAASSLPRIMKPP